MAGNSEGQLDLGLGLRCKPTEPVNTLSKAERASRVGGRPQVISRANGITPLLPVRLWGRALNASVWLGEPIRMLDLRVTDEEKCGVSMEAD